MLTHLRPALVMVVLFTIITGVIYPSAVTVVAELVFPDQASGSLLTRDGTIVGSALIGQMFASDRYFHGRPSAAGTGGYDATASSGSNLGPTSAALIARVRHDIAVQGPVRHPIPADLVTASGSGLDPHITPEAADMQVARVAKARKLPVETVRGLVHANIDAPLLGILGEPRVNVLQLNIALDALQS